MITIYRLSNIFEDNHNRMKESTISFTCVIIQNSSTGSFYGMVKEIEGITVKGSTEDEVVDKIPKAIKAMIEAKSQDATSTSSFNESFSIVKEKHINYSQAI